MTTSRLKLTKSVVGNIEEELEALAFRKRRGGGYAITINANIEGYIGLNLATRLPNNRIGISPIVGVTYQPIERLIEELCSPPPTPIGVTLTTALGYVTPEKRFLQWVFDETLDSALEIAKITLAIREFGLPFMREHDALSAFISDLELKRYTVNDLRRYRLPVAYFLDGKVDLASRSIKEELDGMSGRSDAAAEQYRSFAYGLQDRLS